MVEPIFFLYIVIAIISYGVQAPLLVFFTRKYDSLIVTVYSRLSLAITMLPVLLYIGIGNAATITSHWFELFLASIFGSFGFILSLKSAGYVPVGISETLRQSTYIASAVLLGYLFLSETLSVLTLLLLFGIVVVVSVLAQSKSKQIHLDSHQMWKGYLFGILSGFGFAAGFFFFSLVSREVQPFVATYFWVVGMGLLTTLWLCLQIGIGKYKGKTALPWKTTLWISLLSLTTITGTASFAFAVNHGYFALASGLSAASTAIAALISWFLFKERLSAVQVTAITVAVLLVILIRLTI